MDLLVPDPSVRFGTYELYAATGELRKSGILLRIHPQPFRVLVLLLEKPGKIVTREEFQRCLWGNDTFVDFERGINFCINQIAGPSEIAPNILVTSRPFHAADIVLSLP